MKAPTFNIGLEPDPPPVQAAPSDQRLKVSGFNMEVAARGARLVLASNDPSIQEASKRLRKMFLAYAAAVSLDAKHPTTKTRQVQENAETLLQEAIELELLGL